MPSHQKGLHSSVICKEVWMPEEGFYFCDADCIKKYNTLVRNSPNMHMMPVQRRPKDA